MGGDRRRRFPRSAGDAPHPPGGLDGDAGELRRRATRPPQLARRQESRNRLDDRLGPVERKEVPAGVDDLDGGVAELVLEHLCPTWLEEGIVRAPED